jgi:hypothetical protein
MRTTPTITFQPNQDTHRLIRHVTRRVPQYARRGGLTRMICEAIQATWGPAVMNGRAKYLKRKIKEIA